LQCHRHETPLSAVSRHLGNFKVREDGRGARLDRAKRAHGWQRHYVSPVHPTRCFHYFVPCSRLISRSGPREEFEKVDQATVVPAGQRKFLYNFLGSMTSYSRRVLKRILSEDLAQQAAKYPGFVHITDRWHIKVNTQNGYVTPERYRLLLLDSVFTLCPTGHNPEAYRIYEALEAGSIPILALDRWYNRHDCGEAFKPYRDAGAPFIYLNGGWGSLETFFERRGSNATWVAERQVAVRAWYQWWMHQVSVLVFSGICGLIVSLFWVFGKTALRFEAILEMRFRNRLKGKRDEKAEAEEEEVEKEEAQAILNEENNEEEQLPVGGDEPV